MSSEERCPKTSAFALLCMVSISILGGSGLFELLYRKAPVDTTRPAGERNEQA